MALHQAPLAEFVAERKRLAAELKARGDKDGAAQLGKVPRPPVSAWVVNQLWWKEQRDFEQLIEAAARVKAGDREASQAHRQRLAELREHAARLLEEAGNAATDSTLRRVTTTLSAIAAQGGFEPDSPGALSADRDPPGFESLGSGFVAARSESPRATPAPQPAAPADDRQAEAERRRLEAEKRRAEEEANRRRLAERERLSSAIRDAQSQRTSQLREVARLQRELESAQQSLDETKALLARLEDQLASL